MDYSVEEFISIYTSENHWGHWQTLSHKCCTEYTSPWTRIGLATLVVIGTDCIGSCKSNYHMITTTMAPVIFWSIYGNKFFDTIIHLNYINFQKKILKGILSFMGMCTRYNIYVIKFVSCLRQIGGVFCVLWFPSPIKLTVTIELRYCWKWS
jgi:hypothetical protein